MIRYLLILLIITSCNNSNQTNSSKINNENEDDKVIPFLNYDFSEINNIVIPIAKPIPEYDYSKIDNSYPLKTLIKKSEVANYSFSRPPSLKNGENFELRVLPYPDSYNCHIYNKSDDFLSFNYIHKDGGFFSEPEDYLVVSKTNKNGTQTIFKSNDFSKNANKGEYKLRYINGHLYLFSNRYFIGKTEYTKDILDNWSQIKTCDFEDKNCGIKVNFNNYTERPFKIELLSLKIKKAEQPKTINSEVISLKTSQIKLGKKIIEVKNIINNIKSDNQTIKKDISIYKSKNRVKDYEQAITHSFLKESLKSLQENYVVIEILEKQGTSLFDGYNDIRFLVRKVSRDKDIESILSKEKLTELIKTIEFTNKKYEPIVNEKIELGTLQANEQKSLELIWNENF